MPPRPKSRGKAAVGQKNALFPLARGRGQFGDRDYTSHIRWTPFKITIFAACIAIPYGGTVVALGTVLGWGAAFPLIALGLCVGAITLILYAISRTHF